MLYRFLRPITRIFLKAYFRKIYINGLENIPKEGPLILCSNHPTAFIEPCILACFLPRELHFLVRADLFKKPVLSKILYGTNQLPIYRFRDGIKELRNSHTILNKTYANLASGKAILIFPEGTTQEVRYLRPIKKGTARMAFDTLKQHPECGLKIIPIGLSYSSPNSWRSVANIQIGKPIIPELPENEKEFPRRIRILTEQIFSEMSKLILHLENEERAGILNDAVALDLWERQMTSSVVSVKNQANYFKSQKSLSETIDKIAETQEISEAINDLKGKHALGDISVLTDGIKGNTVIDLFKTILFAIPVSLILLTLLPVGLLGKYFERKYVVQREFQASVLIAASMGAFILFFSIAFIVLVILKGFYALTLFAVPILGLLALAGRDHIAKFFKRIALSKRIGSEQKTALFRKGMLILEQIKPNR